ncbi:hypothetical protein DVH05_001205 [Phytophthora capsici]|nr:hypothetical protein DVH05_001205 [Phytophthora capsici]
MAVAATWKFPIPYGYVIMLNFYVLFFMVGLIFVIGPRVLISSPGLRQQIKAELLIMANQSGVAVLYPVFSAVFNRLPGNYQALFVLVMPLIKFITKQNIANSAQSFHEYVGPVLIFSVDLFNIYYVAICMQHSKSMVTTLILMALDGFHVVLALRSIFHRSNSVQTRQQAFVKHYLRDLPAFIRTEFKRDSSYCRDRRIRLRAPFSLPLSIESKALLDELVRSDTTECETKNTTKNCLQSGPVLVKPSQIAPAKSSLLRRSSSTTERSHTSIAFVREALKTFFHSEYVLLIEYIEFMVPMLYALYLWVLFHLEVASYYPHTATMTADKLKNTVTNMRL